MMLEFADDPALVFVENHATALFLEEPNDLSAYRLTLRTTLNVALAPDATVELITAILAEGG
jgi:hypothetical protein